MLELKGGKAFPGKHCSTEIHGRGYVKLCKCKAKAYHLGRYYCLRHIPK